MKKLLLILLFFCLSSTLFPQQTDNWDTRAFQSTLVKPTQIIDKAPGHTFIDFGQDAFGVLLLTFSQAPSDSIIIHLGEKLTDKQTIDPEPGGTIRYQKVVLKDVPLNKTFAVQTHPVARNENPPAVLLPDSLGRVMPFRYCEIENLSIPITDVEVTQKVYHYAFNETASAFSSSDSVLNQVWDLCKHTIKATSFCGLYVDGDRERIPYEADAYINQLSHYAVDSEYGLAQETIKYFFAHPTWPTEWMLHTIFMVYQDYYYTGNSAILETYYDELKVKTLYELADEDGLISSFSPKVDGEFMRRLGFADTTQRISDIVDWPPAQKDTGWKLSTPQGERDGHEMLPVNTVVNCFYYANMRMLSELAGVLDKQEDSNQFEQMALKAKQAINTKLFDSENGRYIDGIGSTHSSVHSNMLALAFGIVPPEHVDAVVEHVKSRGMGCSVYGAQYLLEGLYRAGAADYALGLMTATEGDRNWYNMIRVGSTMALEAWDIRYKPNLDWNHAWGTAPGNIITRYMWGITPAKPGFEKVQIKPQLASLTESSIKVPTKKGAILAEYKKSANGETYTIKLPKGMPGEFVVAGKKDVKVRFDGKPVSATKKIELNNETNTIELMY